MKSLKENQKQACLIAHETLKWHPQYIAELCTNSNDSGSPEELAAKYIKNWHQKHGDRLYEPFESIDGVRISDHDMPIGDDDADMPAIPLSEWDGKGIEPMIRTSKYYQLQ